VNTSAAEYLPSATEREKLDFDQPPIVTELRDLLGHDVLLLRCEGKKPTGKWGQFTVEAMSDPRYVEKLSRGNIGVALGKVSGGLCAIDIDRDELVAPFLAANPQLDGTLQSHGARGRVFWIRCAGDYPQHTIKLKTNSGGDAGEFRSNGSQSIIAGIHPSTQRPYEIVIAAQPVAVEFSSLQWPEDFVQPTTHTKPPYHLRSLRSHPLTTLTTFSTSHVKSLILNQDEESAIAQCVATEAHQNHRLLFTLARAVKAIEKKGAAPMSSPRLKAVFDRWHELSAPFLRSGQSRDEYFFEFLAALESVIYPLGEGVLDMAWKNAQTSEPPPEAEVIESPDIRLLISLCRELQRAAGDRAFYLATRTIQRLFRRPHPMDGWRWLNGLCRLKILRLVKRGRKHEPGRKGETNEFRYLLQTSNEKANYEN
jgi:hypothetical protein